ncbi:MAG: methyltransferase domain-containing protein [Rhizobiaceae bacterium]|nr:methyltransferase domain-containing protein [Rhizobiaceae bacterium]
MLKFDAKTTKLLEDSYLGADFSRRRRASFDALRVEPQDRIVDIGCGNGLLTVELARAVGDEGRVIGVDPSEDMLSTAREKCAGYENVELLAGTADEIPLGDRAADKAVSLQVFEYLEDLPAAAAEARRVLKPGGRLVVGDIHFDTIAWFSDEPERMQSMIDAWDRHLVERCVPAVLPPILRDCGFQIEGVTAVPFSDSVLRPDGLANMMMLLMERYVVENKLVAADVAAAWRQEQHDLAAAGRFFFSLTHFVVLATKL